MPPRRARHAARDPDTRTIDGTSHRGDRSRATAATSSARRARRARLEKEITLSVARRLRTLIESRLGLKVFLTRDDDRTMSLDERSAFANNHRADVFLSIHANSAVRPALKGAEVYYLTVERADEEARKRADENSTTLPALGGGNRAIDLILWETAQARYLEQSAALAGFVEQSFRGAHRDEPARGAAGAVPGAGRREHAGGAGRDRLSLERRAGNTAHHAPAIRIKSRSHCSMRSSSSANSLSTKRVPKVRITLASMSPRQWGLVALTAIAAVTFGVGADDGTEPAADAGRR